MTTLIFVTEFSNFTRKAWFGGSVYNLAPSNCLFQKTHLASCVQWHSGLM